MTILVLIFLVAAALVLGAFVLWDAVMVVLEERRERTWTDVHELDPGGHCRIVRDE